MPSEPPPEEIKKEKDISDALLKQAMEQIRDLERDAAEAEELKKQLAEAPEEIVRVPTLDKETQTDIFYPTEIEVIKEVEVVREVHFREDADKIDNTEISRDEKGDYRIFESVSNPDDAESTDILTEEFL